MNFDSLEGLTKEQIDELYENIIERDMDSNHIASCNCICNGYTIPCYKEGLIRTRWGNIYGNPSTGTCERPGSTYGGDCARYVCPVMSGCYA